MVYAFDEDGRDPSNAKPDRKYVFTKEQFAKHYSKSNIGHSYSVWIPWDEVGGPQKQISLIVRFTPDKGDVVVGEQTRHLLPGRTPEGAWPQSPGAVNPNAPMQLGAGSAAAAPTDRLQLVSHEEGVPGSEGAVPSNDRLKRRSGYRHHYRAVAVQVGRQRSTDGAGGQFAVVEPAGSSLGAVPGPPARLLCRSRRRRATRRRTRSSSRPGRSSPRSGRRHRQPFFTRQTPGSRRTTLAATSRSCSVATTPCSVAVPSWTATCNRDWTCRPFIARHPLAQIRTDSVECRLRMIERLAELCGEFSRTADSAGIIPAAVVPPP